MEDSFEARILKNVPTCSSCHQEFLTYHPDKRIPLRIPVLLDCCHSICHQCIMKQNHKSSIKCQECDKVTTKKEPG